MATIKLNLNGKNAEIVNEYPIVFSNEDTIDVEIDNYMPEHKYSIHLDVLKFDFEYGKLKLDIRYLDNLKSASITDNGKRYELNVDKFTTKKVINIASGDKLNDLLLVLYSNQRELQKKLDRIIEQIDSGDLLI